jgi:hypothetical protein
MAFTNLLGFRGWESGAIPNEDTYTGGSSGIYSADPRTGVYAIVLGDAVAYYRVPALTSTPNNIGIAVAWKASSNCWNKDNAFRVELHLTSSEIIDIRWEAANQFFDAYVDGVKVADGAVAGPTYDVWVGVQIYVLVADSGTIKTRIDGVDDIDYSGDTLPAGATAEIEYIYLYNSGGGIGTQLAYYDDFAWGTATDLPGDVRIGTALMPNADTAVDDFTASAGDSWSCVDETGPNDDTDYIYSDVNGHETELDLQNFDATNKTPIGVNVFAHARQLAGEGQQLKVGVDSGGTDDTGTKNLSTSWAQFVHFLEDNPDDSLPWEDADLDALKVRVEAVISV